VIRFRIVVAGASVLAMAGCGTGDGRAGAASGVATRMLRAVAGSDGTTACGLLAPRTAAELADSAGQSCADAVLQQHLPGPGAVRSTQVFGQWAQVTLDTDTVFLAVFPGGWRVVGAGCTPRGEDQPYHCTVQGD
jgi:hypothetical protein